jgi:aspartate/glutamate racemase
MSSPLIVSRRPRVEDPVRLFSDYMKITGTPTLAPEAGYLTGKTLALLNGSSWVSLWGTWFGRSILPGVKLLHIGADATQYSFMQAHESGEPCPPSRNIRAFSIFAKTAIKLHRPDAMLLTCSTMNRAVAAVRRAVVDTRIPVVQIDEPMMEAAVRHGGRILVIATHGPTVTSTQALLTETASRLKRSVTFDGATIESAFDLLGRGRIARHNAEIARAIRSARKRGALDSVVLAQLSMAVFLLEHPDPVSEFGCPVFTSAECGFQRIRELLSDS